MPARRESGAPVVVPPPRRKRAKPAPSLQTKDIRIDRTGPAPRTPRVRQIKTPTTSNPTLYPKQSATQKAQLKAAGGKLQRDRRRKRIITNRASRQKAKRAVSELFDASERISALQRKGGTSKGQLPSPRPQTKTQRQTSQDIAKLYAPESKVIRSRRTEAAERLERKGLTPALRATIEQRALAAKPAPKTEHKSLLDKVGGAVTDVMNEVAGPKRQIKEQQGFKNLTREVGEQVKGTFNPASRQIEEQQNLRALAKAAPKAFELGQTLTNPAAASRLRKGSITPEQIAGYFDVPIHVARATAADLGKGTGSKTVKSIPGLLAGVIPGTVGAALHPGKAVREMGEDLKRRYGKGDYATVKKGVEEGGAVPYLLDVGAAAGLAGRAATGPARLAGRARAVRRGREAADNFVDRPRPDIQLAPGVRRAQERSDNLLKLVGQRGEDRLRRAAQGRRERRANERGVAPRGIRPDDEEAVVKLTRRGQNRALKKHQLARHGRNVVEHRATLNRELKDHRRRVARLRPKQRRALPYATELGLPAATSRKAIADGRAALRRHADNIKATRGPDFKLKVGETDELPTIERLIKDYPTVFTPKLREAANADRDLAARTGTVDPGLEGEQAARRAIGPQERALGLTRPDRAEAVTAVRTAAERELRDAETALTRAKREEAYATGRGEAQATSGGRITRKRATGPRTDLTKAQGDRLMNARLNAVAAERRVERARERVNAPADELVGPAPTLDDITSNLDEARTAAGLEPGGYYPHRRSLNDRQFGSFTGGAGVRAVGGPKTTSYSLFDTGRVARDPRIFEEGVARNLKRTFNWRSSGQAMDDYAIAKGSSLRDLDAVMRDQGLDPRDYVAVNPVKFKARETDAARRGVDVDDTGDPLIAQAWDSARAKPGIDGFAGHSEYDGDANWALIPKAVDDAIRGSRGTAGEGLGARLASKILKGIPSKLILGTSPGWLVSQFLNDAALGALAGINPGTILKSERFFRDAELRTKAAPYAGAAPFERELGGVRLGSTMPEQVEDWALTAKAWKARAIDLVPGGRRLEATGVSGNPLDWMLQVDAAKANVVRRSVLYDELRRQAYRNMGSDARGWMRTADQAADVLMLRDPEARIRALLDDPRAMELAADHVDRMLGNYTRFGHTERRLLANNVLFYGFLRFSLRFTFWTMPTRHPVVSSIAAHLSQLHEDEVRDLLGVGKDDPLPFGTLGKYYMLDGNQLMEVPLNSLNPAMNPFTQSDDVGGALRGMYGSLSPLVTELIDQTAGKDIAFDRVYRVGTSAVPLGAFGNQRGASLGERGRIAANDLLSLTTPYRALREANAEGAPISDDSFAWNPTFTEYSKPETAADIAVQRKQFRERGNQDALLDQVLRFRPQPSTLRDRLDSYLQQRGLGDSDVQDQRELANKMGQPGWMREYINATLRKGQRDARNDRAKIADELETLRRERQLGQR